MKLKSILIVTLILAIAAFFLMSCDDDSPSKPGTGGLVGTWVLTKITVISSAGEFSYDPEDMGYSVTVVLNSDNTFQATEEDEEEGTSVETGTWSASGSTLTITSSDGETVSGTYSIKGNKLTITITEEEEGETYTIIQEFTKQG